MLVERLVAARCSDPFSHLGLQANPDGPGLKLTVWLPDAQAVRVRISSRARLLPPWRPPMIRAFETVFTRRKNPFPYQLLADYPDASVEVIDPYQFQDAGWAGLAELTYQPETSTTLGAQLRTVAHLDQQVEGVRFAVYAPSATAVSLIGDFNFWDGRRHPMQRSQCGHWALFVPGLKAGDRYKFELKDLAGNRLPHKSDPVGFYCEQYPSFASVVYDHDQYQWQDAAWRESQLNDKREQPLSIYELHVGSWKRHPNGDSLSWRELAVELVDYVKGMEYTHIELLPVSSTRSVAPGATSRWACSRPPAVTARLMISNTSSISATRPVLASSSTGRLPTSRPMPTGWPASTALRSTSTRIRAVAGTRTGTLHL